MYHSLPIVNRFSIRYSTCLARLCSGSRHFRNVFRCARGQGHALAPLSIQVYCIGTKLKPSYSLCSKLKTQPSVLAHIYHHASQCQAGAAAGGESGPIPTPLEGHNDHPSAWPIYVPMLQSKKMIKCIIQPGEVLNRLRPR